MSNVKRKKTNETEKIEQALRAAGYKNVVSYRQNSASIRVRVIDARFRRKSRVERDEMVTPILDQLPEDTQSHITILLLLTPEETSRSMMNVEFEDPVESAL